MSIIYGHCSISASPGFPISRVRAVISLCCLSDLSLWMWCPEGVFPWAGADFCTELACTYKVTEQINSVGTKLRL